MRTEGAKDKGPRKRSGMRSDTPEILEQYENEKKKSTVSKGSPYKIGRFKMHNYRVSRFHKQEGREFRHSSDEYGVHSTATAEAKKWLEQEE